MRTGSSHSSQPNSCETHKGDMVVFGRRRLRFFGGKVLALGVECCSEWSVILPCLIGGGIDCEESLASYSKCWSILRTITIEVTLRTLPERKIKVRSRASYLVNHGRGFHIAVSRITAQNTSDTEHLFKDLGRRRST